VPVIILSIDFNDIEGQNQINFCKQIDYDADRKILFCRFKNGQIRFMQVMQNLLRSFELENNNTYTDNKYKEVRSVVGATKMSSMIYAEGMSKYTNTSKKDAKSLIKLKDYTVSCECQMVIYTDFGCDRIH